jgi:outer membrane protein OmpA-like peptidoglycan-associated protein
MKLKINLFLLLISLTFSACENAKFGAREKGALGGAAVGAGLGAIIGNQVGSAGAGVAIGSAFGALSGALIGNELDNQNEALEQRTVRLDQQQKEIEENQRLIAELRAKGVDASSTPRGVSINLPDVLFAFDSYQLTSAAADTVRDITQSLEGRIAGRKILVEGHTDSVGSDSYNLELSKNRAQSVARQLSKEGLSSSQIAVRGYGESKPIATNDSELGRQRNRRVEVILQNSTY